MPSKRKRIPSEQDFFDFHNKTRPFRFEVQISLPDTLSGMLQWAATIAANRDDHIKAHEMMLRAHVVHEYLLDDTRMQAALSRFRSLARKSGALGYGQPRAEWNFFGSVAWLVGLRRSHPDLHPMPPTLAQAENASSIALSLIAAMKECDVRLPNLQDQHALELLLAAFVEQLAPQVKNEARRNRIDSGSAERYYLDALIGMLLTEFGTVSPALVSDIAPLLVSEIPSQSTVTRRIKEVKKRRRNWGPPVLPLPPTFGLPQLSSP